MATNPIPELEPGNTAQTEDLFEQIDEAERIVKDDFNQDIDELNSLADELSQIQDAPLHEQEIIPQDATTDSEQVSSEVDESESISEDQSMEGDSLDLPDGEGQEFDLDSIDTSEIEDNNLDDLPSPDDEIIQPEDAQNESIDQTQDNNLIDQVISDAREAEEIDELTMQKLQSVINSLSPIQKSQLIQSMSEGLMPGSSDMVPNQQMMQAGPGSVSNPIIDTLAKGLGSAITFLPLLAIRAKDLVVERRLKAKQTQEMQTAQHAKDISLINSESYNNSLYERSVKSMNSNMSEYKETLNGLMESEFGKKAQEANSQRIEHQSMADQAKKFNIANKINECNEQSAVLFEQDEKTQAMYQKLEDIQRQMSQDAKDMALSVKNNPAISMDEVNGKISEIEKWEADVSPSLQILSNAKEKAEISDNPNDLNASIGLKGKLDEAFKGIMDTLKNVFNKVTTKLSMGT